MLFSSNTKALQFKEATEVTVEGSTAEGLEYQGIYHFLLEPKL